MSASAKNKWLVFSSILVGISLAVLYIANIDVLKNWVGRHEDGIFKTEYEEYPDQNFPTQDSVKVDFDGLKNDTIPLPKETIQLIKKELNGFNWNEAFREKEIYNLFHETIFAEQLPGAPNASKRYIVVVFSNYSGNFYHAARGMLSLFEFRMLNKGWQLTGKYLAFGFGTEFGLEPQWCKLVQIGSNNKYALIVQTNYSGNGGHDTQTQSVYAELNQTFELVFSFTNYEYYFDYPKDIEYTEGYSSMRFLKSNKAWFDIETKSDETKWNDKTPGAVKRFEFNGEEYVRVK